ncbi:MAG TPA: TIGR03435 family protein [Vicinamibacterales bacterium]|nr:TIGR03435 family protein [Vicinamibacterales bacterium]
MVVQSSTDHRGFGATAVVVAQSPPRAFEVASVKRSPPDARGSVVSGPTPGGFTARNVSLERLILYAYGVNQYQLAEAPDWIRAERFDIAGRYPDDWQPGEVSSMVRQLLADRFQLKTHADSRAVDGYALRRAQATGRLGSRLQSSSTDCAELIATNGPSVVKGLDDKPVCIGFMTGEAIRVGTRPLATLASMLSSILQQPVTDATGLSGNFDFELDWSPELPATPGTAAAASDKPSLFTALQEQLGLKLERIRTDVPVIVIDHIERPSEN